MESLVNFDLGMYPDIADMLEDVKAGDKIKLYGCFVVKELSDKKMTATFDDSESDISIKLKEDESEAEDETDSDTETPETEEASG